MKQCTMNCGPSAWDKRSREQMMSECDDCITQPCNPAEDGVCEALECCKHGVEDGACKECYDDTALLKQALEFMNELLPATSEISAEHLSDPTLLRDLELRDAIMERLK